MQKLFYIFLVVNSFIFGNILDSLEIKLSKKEYNAVKLYFDENSDILSTNPKITHESPRKPQIYQRTNNSYQLKSKYARELLNANNGNDTLVAP